MTPEAAPDESLSQSRVTFLGLLLGRHRKLNPGRHPNQLPLAALGLVNLLFMLAIVVLSIRHMMIHGTEDTASANQHRLVLSMLLCTSIGLQTTLFTLRPPKRKIGYLVLVGLGFMLFATVCDLFGI